MAYIHITFVELRICRSYNKRKCFDSIPWTDPFLIPYARISALISRKAVHWATSRVNLPSLASGVVCIYRPSCSEGRQSLSVKETTEMIRGWVASKDKQLEFRLREAFINSEERELWNWRENKMAYYQDVQ